MTHFNQNDSAACLATIMGNNVNTIRVHGTTGKFIVTDSHGDPTFLGGQVIIGEFAFDEETYRVKYRAALALAAEAALEGIEDDEDDLSEDYPGQRIGADPPCPGCGSFPGDGITEGCTHPEGCGAFAR